jgi:hypothetical protein
VGRLGVSLPVDGQRAPFPGASPRLSTAISKTLNKPIPRPYPLRLYTLLRYVPHRPEEYVVLKEHMGWPEPEILMALIA